MGNAQLLIQVNFESGSYILLDDRFLSQRYTPPSHFIEFNHQFPPDLSRKITEPERTQQRLCSPRRNVDRNFSGTRALTAVKN